MTNGIHYIYLETHNWGKTVKFWQQLGFDLDLDLGTSGRLIHREGGSAIFVEEVPEDRALAQQIYLHASDTSTSPGPPVEIEKDWHASHWGPKLLEVRDPDGRSIMISSGAETG